MKVFYFLPILIFAFTIESKTQNQPDSITHNFPDTLEFYKYQGQLVSIVIINQIVNNFNQGHIYDPLGLAEGRIAGLSITKPGDDPNTKYDVRIRGLSNIHGNTMPLIVIDGYLDASLENVDPADIESMTVIKDASATAFYGIRGANGVILISTKKGDGKPQVSYNTYLNVENAIRQQPAMTTDEYLAFSDEVDFVQATDFGYDTDWYNEILNTAISQAHNLSVSGGNLSNKFYGSLNYRNVDGVLANSGFDRFSTRFNVEHKALKRKLTLGLSVAGTFNNSEYGNSDAFRYAPIYNPTAPVRSDDPVYERYDGYFQQILFDYYNPAAIVEQTDNNGQYTVFNMRLLGNYDITDKLAVNASYSMQTAGMRQNMYYSKYSYYRGIDRNGLAFKSSSDSYNQLFEAGLRWTNKVDFGNIDIEAGYSYQEFTNEGFFAEGGDFISDAFTYNRLAAANDFNKGRGKAESYKNSTTISGWYGKVNYSWKDKVFVNLVGRYDGSSMFGENEKYGFYPGISSGVDFAQILYMSSFNLMKLRVGYGKSGQTIGGDYRATSQLAATDGSVYYNGGYIQRYELANMGNPDLKAPVKSEINIGLDFDYKSLFYGSLDYYSNTISDLIWPFYSITPGAMEWYNCGEMNNSGLEFSINAFLFTEKKLTWTPSLILTNYFNTSLGNFSDEEKGYNFPERNYLNPTFPGSSDLGKNIVQENEKVGNFYGLTYKEISENGQWVFKDIDEDQIISAADRSVIGNAMPKVELGFGNYFTYGRWDLSVFFKGLFGHEIINEYWAMYGAPRHVTYYNVPSIVKEMKAENEVYLRDGAKFSTYYLEKGNFFKLDNFSLGYNFILKQSSSIKDLKVYFTGNNVFVITSYSGSDPDIRYSDSAFEYNPLAPGMERMSEWLMSRSFALGLTVKF